MNILNIIVSSIIAATLSIAGLLGFTDFADPAFPPDFEKQIQSRTEKYAGRLFSDWDSKVQGLIEGYVNLSLTDEKILGATLPIAGATYNLSGAGITSSATSIILRSLTLPQNGYVIADGDLSGTFYITLEPGSRARQEIVSCTTVVQNSTGTATLSGCTRGLSPISPFTASTTLQFAHGGGTQVIFSDPPQLFNQFAALDNEAAINGEWSFYTGGVFFSSSTPYYATAPTFSSSTQIISKQYADDLAILGAPVAASSTTGIVRLAEPIEAASTSPFNVHGTTSPLTISTLLTAGSRERCVGDASTSTYCVPLTRSDGFLDESFISTTSPYSWSGRTVFGRTASTTIIDNPHYDLGVAGELLVGATTTTGSLIATTTSLKIGGLQYEFPGILGATGTVMTLGADGQLSFQFIGQGETLTPKFAGELASTTSEMPVDTNTTMYTGLYTVTEPIIVNRLAIEVEAVTTAGTADIGMFSGDGQNKFFDVTTGTINGTGPVTVVISSVFIPAGNHYFVIVPNGTANFTVLAYDPPRASTLNSLSAQPRYKGIVTVTAGTLPSTFDPVADIATTTSQAVTPVFRLDN